MKLHTFSIVGDPPKTKVYLDGQPLAGVVAANVGVTLDELAKVTIEMHVRLVAPPGSEEFIKELKKI